VPDRRKPWGACHYVAAVRFFVSRFYSRDTAGQAIFGFAAMDGFHVQGMSEHKWNVQFIAKISNPVPCKYALNTDDDIVQIWHYEL